MGGGKGVDTPRVYSDVCKLQAFEQKVWRLLLKLRMHLRCRLDEEHMSNGSSTGFSLVGQQINQHSCSVIWSAP